MDALPKKPAVYPIARPVSRIRIDLLTTPFFLGCLALLLLNDFVLKAAVGNWWTGKLSDFAGVPLFAIFATAFLPRYRITVFMGTAIAFALWKSPYSQLLIDAWNELNLWQIARVVDYTDLIALLMLPVAFWIAGNKPGRGQDGDGWRSLSRTVVLGVSLFAVVATGSQSEVSEYDLEYEFSVERDELVEMVMGLDYEIGWQSAASTPYPGTISPSSVPGAIISAPVVLHVPTATCGAENREDYIHIIAATIMIDESTVGSKLRLYTIDPRCAGHDPPGPEVFFEAFEIEVIERLRAMTLANPS